MRDSAVIVIDKLEKDREFIVRDGENKTFVIFLTDGLSHKGDIKVSIKGKGSMVQILGIITGLGNEQINLYTFQDHQAAGSISDLFIKSVLFHKSKLYYRGLIKIEKKAQKSNAYQKNQNLLMSDNAWADSRPYLEILANDVRCTHGATIGRINPEQMYYLQSRGLADKEARTLIIEGYYQEVLDRIPDGAIKKLLEKNLKKVITNVI